MSRVPLATGRGWLLELMSGILGAASGLVLFGVLVSALDSF
jgi:hypothetical protein